MNVFHVSEEEDIKLFVPRPAPKSWPELNKDYVWAISEEMLPNYLLPRDCPRICLRSDDSSSNEDITNFLNGTPSPLFILENSWRKKIEKAVLFLYEFDRKKFHLLDEIAGYWVSETTQRPLKVSKLVDPLEKLKQLGVRISFRSELLSLGEEIANSSLRFSMIRLRNARENT